MSEGPDFFISYTQADRRWAEWIAWQLEQEHYTTRIQAWDFRPGTNFVAEMDEAVKKAKRTLLVLSPAYFGSTFAGEEWKSVFAKNPEALLPVRVAV